MTATMLAGRLNVDTARFALEEIPVPEPGHGEVRVRVRAAGVCLSDVHLVEGSLRPRFLEESAVTLGHEVAGEIDALGPGVPEGWKPGARVLLQAGERCGRCARCVRYTEPCLSARTRGVDYDGGWAEYALATHHTLVSVPDELPLEQAAIVPDAVSTPWAALVSTADVRPAQPVGVWGVGGLGAHGIQLLRLVGAAPIVAVDPLESARARALDFGADAVFDPGDPELPRRVGAATGGHGLDAAFDFAGVPAVREQAAECLAPQGKLTLVGLTPEPLTITDGVRFSFAKQQLRGHYGSSPAHVEQLVELTRHRRLDLSRSVSDTMPLSEAGAAIERLQRGGDTPIRLVLTP
ncbi:zinc-binding dehydrogenase [Actinopolyspora mortivallis]|uniref:zinc-binding dehydrogenase n=1 Tax=Actinopolyspora mortivallis TaxID=33906 RepID=UPI00036DDA97|nr:zinc-binding dehydrogenase [Actinopolyspora mortivallis]